MRLTQETRSLDRQGFRNTFTPFEKTVHSGPAGNIIPENCSLDYSSLAITYSLALLNGCSFASFRLLAKLSNADAMSMSARKSVDVNRSPLCKFVLRYLQENVYPRCDETPKARFL